MGAVLLAFGAVLLAFGALATLGTVAVACVPDVPLTSFMPGPVEPVVAVVAPDTNGPLRMRGHDLVDADGRTVLLHGMNSVNQEAPFTSLLTDGSLGPTYRAYLVRVGFNAVRLGVVYSALMPEAGVIDASYLGQVVAEFTPDHSIHPPTSIVVPGRQFPVGSSRPAIPGGLLRHGHWRHHDRSAEQRSADRRRRARLVEGHGRHGARRPVATDQSADQNSAEAESHLFEAHLGSVFVDIEDAGNGAHVVTADGEHPAVEVLALDLDHSQVAREHLGLVVAHLLQTGQIDLRPAVVDVTPHGQFVIGFALTVGQQLVDRHLVEPSEALQTRNRDGPLATLVGTENAGLELLCRDGFDLLQRQTLLPADVTQTVADGFAVAGRRALVLSRVVAHVMFDPFIGHRRTASADRCGTPTPCDAGSSLCVIFRCITMR